MSDELFDVNKLSEQCGGSNAVVMMVLEEFQNQTPIDVSGIDTALQAGDVDAASKVAHSLKGASGTMGAMMLHGLSAEVEAACRHDKDIEKANSLFPKLKEVAQQTLDAIPTVMAKFS
ncbi:MAG: Hpt domain-containing protein [Planctomycetaceae bacterium]|jgi:HPt (histidine-containing phosphotransfer) domain-containing protein|nr:Hpt domain-containing protein [Planctomycetaceae bacterium]